MNRPKQSQWSDLSYTWHGACADFPRRRLLAREKKEKEKKKKSIWAALTILAFVLSSFVILAHSVLSAIIGESVRLRKTTKVVCDSELDRDIVTCFTDLATCNIGRVTLHSLAGISLEEKATIHLV